MLNFLEKNNNLTRKEREKLFKRFEILNSAATLFAKNGYDGTKLEDIADAAEFGKGTIYNYFETKEDIYLEIIDRVTDSYTKKLLEMDSQSKSLYEFVSLITKNLIQFILNDQSAFLMLLRLRTEINTIEKVRKSKIVLNYITTAREIFKKKVNKGIKEKEIKKINVEHFTLLFRNLLFPYFHSILIQSKNKITEKELIEAGDFVISTLFNGIKK